MEEAKARYLEHFRQILRESYLELKEKGAYDKEKTRHLDGYMLGGRFFGVTFEELQSIIEETNLEVFGMTIETRRQCYTEKKCVQDQPAPDYDVPAWIRKGKKIEI